MHFGKITDMPNITISLWFQKSFISLEVSHGLRVQKKIV